MKKIFSLSIFIIFIFIGKSYAQTDTIAFQGFEDGNNWTINSGNNRSSATGSGDTPANQRIRTGSYSAQTNNSSNTLILNGVSDNSHISRYVEIWTSSTSATSSNGADSGDSIAIYLSQTSSFNSLSDVTIKGYGNLRYGMNGTGTISTDAGTHITYKYSSGGTKTGDDAKSKIIINIPDSWQNIYLKIVTKNNSSSEFWNIDDISLIGTKANYDKNSDIILSSSFTEPSNIPYQNYQTSDISAGSNDIKAAEFTIRDGGASDDNDTKPTILTDISFTIQNYQDIRRVAIYDGNTELAEKNAAENISFSGLNLSCPDNGTKNFSIRISFLSSVTDNDQLKFTITSASADGAKGSIFANSDAGGAASSTNNDENRIEVTADRLNFFQQPSDAQINECMSPDVSVEAIDINGNRDLDFNSDIGITSAGTMIASQITTTATNGLAVFSGSKCIIHTKKGDNLTLTAQRSPQNDWNTTSSDFNIWSACGTEEFNNGTTPPAGWTFSGINSTYTSSGNYGNSSPSVKFDNSNDQIITANVSSPALLQFWIKGNSTDNISALLVEGWDGSNWQTIDNIKPLPTTGTTKKYTNVNSYSKFRFTYTKSAGNLAFDDLKTWCDCASPSSDASDLIISNNTENSLDLNWTNGNGYKRLVVCRQGAAVSFTPSNNTSYSANSDYSAATEVGNSGEGNKIVFNGQANSASVTGLTPGKSYFFKIFEYNCDDGVEKYLTNGTPASASDSTLPANVKNMNITCITNTTATLTWNLPEGNFDGILITARENTNPPTKPNCNGNSLNSPNSDFSAASVYCGNGTDSRYVYNATGTSVKITGLTNAANYVFKAFTYNGPDWSSGTQKSTIIQIPDVTNLNAFEANQSATITWKNPSTCFDEIMVVARKDSSVSDSPSGDGSNYSANSNFGSGSDIGSNEYVVYKGTNQNVVVNNLTNDTTYYFKIFVRKGNEWSNGVEISVVPTDITTFKPGDLIIIGYDTKTSGNDCSQDATIDVYYILTMVDIKPKTSFGFLNASYEYGAPANVRTDKFYSCSSTPGTYAPGRVKIRWDGTTTIPAGSILQIYLTATSAASYIAINGKDSTNKFYSTGSYCNLSENNPDQIWLYQGVVSNYGESPDIYSKITGNILYGLSNQADWVPFSKPVSTARTSRVHPDIECFNLDFAGDVPTNYYNTSATHSGSKRTLLTNIMDQTNWTSPTQTACNDIPDDVATSTFTISAGNSAGTWRGNINADWFTCGNWEDLTVPDSSFDVIIDKSKIISYSPVISDTSKKAPKFGYTAHCNNITIDTTLKIEASNKDTLRIAGNLTIQNSGTLDMDDQTSNPDGIIFIAGNWNDYANFYPGNGTVIFNSQNSQNINSSASTETFYNLFITNSNINGVKINSNLQINDTILLSNSCLNLNAKNLTISGPEISINSYFIGNIASDININGSGTLSNIQFKTDTNINNLSLDRSGQTLNILSNLNIAGNLTIKNGTLALDAGHFFSVGGTLTNSAGVNGLILKSNAQGTASLFTNNAVEATCQRYLSGGKWHYIFSPLSNADISQLTTTSWNADNPNFYYYKESVADFWKNYTLYNPSGWTAPDHSGKILTDRGYIFRSTESKTYNLSGGNINVSDKSFTLSYTKNGSGTEPNTGTNWDEFDGWNLIGNPFTTAIDWDNSNIDKSNIEDVIYYFDDSDNKYKYYGIGARNLGITVNGGARYMPANQAVFVKAKADANGKTLKIPASARVHNHQNFFKKSAIKKPPMLRLSISDNKNYTDETLIIIAPDASDGHDASYDAYKKIPWGKKYPQIYSLALNNSIHQAINAIPFNSNNKTINLGIYKPSEQTLKLSMSQNSLQKTLIWIEDKKTNLIHNLLKKNNFSFSDTNTTIENRFVLHLSKDNPPFVNTQIPTQYATQYLNWSFKIPDNIFSDNDFDDSLKISANLQNGSQLPKWLKFKNNSFSGIPPIYGSITITLCATDLAGLKSSCSFNLKIAKNTTYNKKFENQTKIYPNPTKGKLYINLPFVTENTKIQIFSISAKLLEEIHIKTKNSIIDLSALQKGSYLVRITNENVCFTKMIILQ